LPIQRVTPGVAAVAATAVGAGLRHGLTLFLLLLTHKLLHITATAAAAAGQGTV
jgi:hypothetical protein